MTAENILNPEIFQISSEEVDKTNSRRIVLIIFLYLTIGIGANYFKFATENLADPKISENSTFPTVAQKDLSGSDTNIKSKSYYQPATSNSNSVTTNFETKKEIYKFEGFPSTPIYYGSAASLLMNSDLANNFRTRLSEALQTQEPEFAGEYVAVRWGCGSQCNVTAFVNKRTGQVLGKKFGGEFSIDVKFKVDSKLLIAEDRELNENFDEIGKSVSYYVLDGEDFKLLKKLLIENEPDKELIEQTLAQSQGIIQEPAQVTADQNMNISQPYYKTSFNCLGELSIVENLICSNSNIANLDIELSQKFDLLKANQAYVSSQREWIRARNKCEDAICLEDIYKKRLSAIQNNGRPSLDKLYETGRKFANESKYTEAYNIWLPLAESGDSESQMGLAKLYLRGHGVPANHNEGFKWTEKAALQNNAEAQHYLGMLYKNGDGITVDAQKSDYWFKKAKENGYQR